MVSFHFRVPKISRSLQVTLVLLFIASGVVVYFQPDFSSSRSSSSANLRELEKKVFQPPKNNGEMLDGLHAKSGAAGATSAGVIAPTSNKVHQVIFVMGVEGTGHHGIKPLLHEMTNKTGILMFEANNPHQPFGRASRHCLEIRSSACLQRIMREVVQNASDHGTGSAVVFKGSLPGRKNNPRAECLFWKNASQVNCMEELAKFPFYDLAWIMGAVKVVVPDVKVIMLNRDFANLVMSHEVWDGGLDHHAKTMAVFLQYICHVVRTAVPTTDWVRLDYESFATVEVGSLLRSLGHFLGWQTDWLTKHSIHDLQKVIHISSRNATKSMPADELALVQTVMHDYTSSGKWKERDDQKHYLLNRYPVGS